jgi:maltose alpha-D-glucosyltransferase / alpha-amylase
VKREDRFSIIDIMRQTPDIPDNCQWAMFLRNHDELTLEMVTDEERDFMYKAYATDDRARINFGIRRRLAPLLTNDRRQIELLNGLLFSLPGTPIIYYGDEIGMGDNIYLGDRNGVRTPFQWNSDRNAGFSTADPQQLFLPVVITPEYHYTTVNVETHRANPNSLMRWMQALVDLRKQSIALTRGKLKFLTPDNEKVLAFIREHESGQTVLVLANLSRRAQYAELDLSPWRGAIPVEMRGETPFPAIGELPYLVTLGPHDFYWFDLTGLKPATAPPARRGVPLSRLPAPDKLMDQPKIRQDFERMLKDYLPKARWFAAKDNTIRNVAIYDIVNVSGVKTPSALVIVNVHYRDLKDKIDTYLLTAALSEGADADRIIAEKPDCVIGIFDLESGGRAIYHEALINTAFSKPLLQTILRHKHSRGRLGALIAGTLKPAEKRALP